MFLCDDLIPPLFSDLSSVRCKRFGNGNQAVAGTKLVFSLVVGLEFCLLILRFGGFFGFFFGVGVCLVLFGFFLRGDSCCGHYCLRISCERGSNTCRKFSSDRF